MRPGTRTEPYYLDAETVSLGLDCTNLVRICESFILLIETSVQPYLHSRPNSLHLKSRGLYPVFEFDYFLLSKSDYVTGPKCDSDFFMKSMFLWSFDVLQVPVTRPARRNAPPMSWCLMTHVGFIPDNKHDVYDWCALLSRLINSGSTKPLAPVRAVWEKPSWSRRGGQFSVALCWSPLFAAA